MQLFYSLFGSFVQFSYRCFDRIVLNGYLSYFTWEGNVVYFFRQVCGWPKVTKQALLKRTQEYRTWVEGYARRRGIPMEWATPIERQDDYVRPALARMRRQNKTGVYTILKRMEQGPTFRLVTPKYPTQDPNHQFVHRHTSRYTFYYFYLVDSEMGPMALRIGTFLPFPVTAYLNGHWVIERELQRRGIAYRMDDNSFVSVEDPKALQAISDAMTAQEIQARVDHWTFVLGPKFSKKERAAGRGLGRFWAMSQIEYCDNFVFKRGWPIRHLFERSCELGLYLLTADRIALIFGRRLTRWLNGKLQNVMERMHQGFLVFRAYWKHSFVKQYHKPPALLRNEVVSNNLNDFGLRKGLAAHFDSVRDRFKEVLERFSAFQARTLNVHGELSLLNQLARPVQHGRSQIAGITLENERVQRLLEIFLFQGHSLPAWNIRQDHKALVQRFDLDPRHYRLSQLRYDLRKLKPHGLAERDGRRYAYRLTPFGQKVATLMTLFRKRIYGPLASGLLHHRPQEPYAPDSSFERQYHRVDHEIDKLLNLLAA